MLVALAMLKRYVTMGIHPRLQTLARPVEVMAIAVINGKFPPMDPLGLTSVVQSAQHIIPPHLPPADGTADE